ncbi:MAG: periplasmic heavy metal sensor [Desulfovibrio sp.]|nr:periplasmic heavy metal sensor [Desulfovibrio sp.]
MKSFNRTLLGILAMAFLTASSAFAAPAAGNPGEARPCDQEKPCLEQNGPKGHHGNIPALTAEQRAGFRAIVAEYEAKFREIADQLFIKENELQALKHAVQPDVKAVSATAKEIVDLRNARRDLLRVIDERAEKELGIKRPQRRVPGMDFTGPHHGPRGHYGHRGGHNARPCGD